MTQQPKDYWQREADQKDRADREEKRANRWRLGFIFLATCVAVLGIAAAAHSAPAEHLSKLCPMYGRGAEGIMAARQLGQPMTEYMQIAAGDAFMEDMVRAAYDRPRWQTEAAIVDEVREFSSQIEAECWRRLAQ